MGFWPIPSQQQRHPRKGGGPAFVDANQFADSLLTCASLSIPPSTFLRAAIAERLILASQARGGSVCGEDARLVRASPFDGRRHSAREADQEMEPGLEISTDRGHEPGWARSH